MPVDPSWLETDFYVDAQPVKSTGLWTQAGDLGQGVDRSVGKPPTTGVGPWASWHGGDVGGPADVVAELAVPFDAAANGSIGSVDVPGHGTVVLQIPPGTGDGTVIRLVGLGAPQPYRMRGDLVVTIRVALRPGGGDPCGERPNET